jgi:hypothetical protein
MKANQEKTCAVVACFIVYMEREWGIDDANEVVSVGM